MKKTICKTLSGILVGLFFAAQTPAILAGEIAASPLSAQNLKTESVSLSDKRVTLRILSPSEGKKIRNKVSGDIYGGNVYLGIEESIDNFEEVDESAIAMLEENKAEQALDALKNLKLSDLTDSDKLMQAQRALEALKNLIHSESRKLAESTRQEQ